MSGRRSDTKKKELSDDSPKLKRSASLRSSFFGGRRKHSVRTQELDSAKDEQPKLKRSHSLRWSFRRRRDKGDKRQGREKQAQEDAGAKKKDEIVCKPGIVKEDEARESTVGKLKGESVSDQPNTVTEDEARESTGSWSVGKLEGESVSDQLNTVTEEQSPGSDAIESKEETVKKPNSVKDLSETSSISEVTIAETGKSQSERSSIATLDSQRVNEATKEVTESSKSSSTSTERKNSRLMVNDQAYPEQCLDVSLDCSGPEVTSKIKQVAVTGTENKCCSLRATSNAARLKVRSMCLSGERTYSLQFRYVTTSTGSENVISMKEDTTSQQSGDAVPDCSLQVRNFSEGKDTAVTETDIVYRKQNASSIHTPDDNNPPQRPPRRPKSKIVLNKESGYVGEQEETTVKGGFPIKPPRRRSLTTRTSLTSRQGQTTGGTNPFEEYNPFEDDSTPSTTQENVTPALSHRRSASATPANLGSKKAHSRPHKGRAPQPPGKISNTS